ncbi:MAG: carbohydrate kinase family protein [Lachnospiraceae bacterium]
MKKEYDVIALGEMLIDFTQYGSSEQGNGLFEANPGGAPCNVLALLSKLGKKTAFIGKVGADQFGYLLRDTAANAGIDVSQMKYDQKVPTTLAFVHTFADGDRDFSFYRSPGADMMLTAEELDLTFLNRASIFHFGTLSMTAQGVRHATQTAVEYARSQGLLISFDPNFREPLWEDPKEAKTWMRYGLSICDVLKIADNEVTFLTGIEDYDQAVEKLREEYDIPLILLTLGRDGSRAYYKDLRVEQPGFVCDTIETTGAGDTFMGTALYHLLQSEMTALDEEKLEQMLLYANAAAALVTTKKGAIKAMPAWEEIEALVQTGRTEKTS